MLGSKYKELDGYVNASNKFEQVWIRNENFREEKWRINGNIRGCGFRGKRKCLKSEKIRV